MADKVHSDLAERLLRRATDRIGVVDVRHAQERYARAAAWPRQHVTLLERSAARAQVASPPDQGSTLLLAARAADSSVLHEMVARQAGMPASGSHQPGFVPRNSVVAGAASPASALSSSGGPMRSGAMKGERIAGPPMRAVSRPVADVAPTPVPVVARASTDSASHSSAATSELTMRTVTAHTWPAAAAAADAGVAAARAMSIPDARETLSPPVFVQRRIGAKAQSPDAAELKANSARADRPRSHGMQSAAPAPGPDTAVATIAAPISQAQAVARADTAEVGRSPAGDRGSLTLRAGVAAGSSRRASPVVWIERRPSANCRCGFDARHPSPSGGTAQPQMVWRRDADAQTRRSILGATPTAPAGMADAARGGSSLDAFHASAATAGAPDTPAATSATSGGGAGGGLDLERVVDEVTRRIVDRGIVQRDRRGGL